MLPSLQAQKTGKGVLGPGFLIQTADCKPWTGAQLRAVPACAPLVTPSTAPRIDPVGSSSFELPAGSVQMWHQLHLIVCWSFRGFLLGLISGAGQMLRQRAWDCTSAMTEGEEEEES